VISAANVAPLHAVGGTEHEAVEEDISKAANTVVIVVGHGQNVLRSRMNRVCERLRSGERAVPVLSGCTCKTTAVTRKQPTDSKKS
jgi:creatinine amidohydrolase/Fe(II)-dependent formamide hydrolase-like protein